MTIYNRPNTAKLTFEVDIASYDLDGVIKRGDILKYFRDALRLSSDRNCDFVWGNEKMVFEGELHED